MIFCSLYSGSSGNSIFVSTGKSKVLIDAGMPGKSIEKALNEIGETCENLDGIFVTHEHGDHTKGVGILSRKYNIPIFANSSTWEAMAKSLGNIKDENIKIINNASVCINDMDILSYDIPHDAAAPCGYALFHNNKKVCIATDLGHFSENIKNQLKDADVILLESNHDIEMLKFGPYPYPLKRRILSDVGHLSNEACGKAIVELTNHKQKTIILGHLSRTNNFPELAYKTVVNILEENNIELNKDVILSMAKRDMPSNFIEF
jgi:phosphoribosyl 1,2-cyclic phosphodiesterase